MKDSIIKKLKRDEVIRYATVIIMFAYDSLHLMIESCDLH